MQPSYGTAGPAAHMPKSMISFAQRRSANVRAIVLSLVVPLLVFAALFAILSLSVRCERPALVWLAMACGVLMTVLVAFRAAVAVRKAHVQPQSESAQRTPSSAWCVFYGVSMVVALGAAIALGDANYWNNTRPHCELTNLSRYTHIKPDETSGLQLMDAGEVVFTKDATIGLNTSMSFKNVLRYCVAPIVSANATKPAQEVDLWAVGINCCAIDYKCGEYHNEHAHAGLRVVRKDQREFYQLAVQQAEAAYGLRAQNPVFFYWTEDPSAASAAYQEDALEFLLYGIIASVAYQIFAVIVAMLTFRKLGLE